MDLGPGSPGPCPMGRLQYCTVQGQYCIHRPCTGPVQGLYRPCTLQYSTVLAQDGSYWPVLYWDPWPLIQYKGDPWIWVLGDLAHVPWASCSTVLYRASTVYTGPVQGLYRACTGPVHYSTVQYWPRMAPTGQYCTGTGYSTSCIHHLMSCVTIQGSQDPIPLIMH